MAHRLWNGNRKSYLWPYLVSFPTYRPSQLLVESRRIYIPHLYSAPWISQRYLVLRKLEWSATMCAVKPFQSECDGRTDERTDGQNSYISITLLYRAIKTKTKNW